MDTKLQTYRPTHNVVVIGHRNPDTDSICSAIAYSYLKNHSSKLDTEPRRAGEINQETAFVLKYFGVPVPRLCTDVSPQVQDLEFRQMPGIEATTSVHKTWELMRKDNIDTLPVVTKNGQLESIVTLTDVSDACMDVLDTRILAESKTPYRNILEVLDGEMLVGDPDGCVETGKLGLAAGNPEAMESFLEPGDMVILSSRYEFQFCALEMGAGCLIVCSDAEMKVPKTIQKLAEERGCTVIVTPKDFYSTARLLSLASPVRHYMRLKDNILTFTLNTPLDDAQKVMAQVRYHYFPVVTRGGKYVGLLSRRNLLNLRRRQLIMVDHNEKSQAVEGFENAEILEIIDHHRIGSLETMAPVYFRNEPVGCTATIIYQIYREKGYDIPPQIAGLLCSAILSDTLVFRSPTCTMMDRMAADALSAIAGIDCQAFGIEMFTAGSNLKDKTPEEIFYQDYKKFEFGDVTFGVGQINSMSGGELDEIEKKLRPYLEKSCREHGLTMMYFMLTNIIEESTRLMCYGEAAEQLVQEAFGRTPQAGTVWLKGVVSRKKQLIPAFIDAINKENS